MKKIFNFRNLLLCALTLPLAHIAHAEQGSRSGIVKGVVVTGANDYCGKAIWSFEDQGINATQIRQLGAYDAGGERANLLDADNCKSDTVLASFHDPVLSFDPPGPPGPITSEPDVRLQNIPLRDIPKVAGIFQGGTAGVRNFLGTATNTPVNPFPAISSAKEGDITFKDWSSAKGVLTYRCRADGTARVRVRMQNLIPNGVYSMWGIWKTPLPNGIFVDVPVAFGGVPNAIVPDSRGRVKFERDLAFCPGKETPDESTLLWVTAAYHSDSSLYAGVPDAANTTHTFVDKDGNAFDSNLGLMVHHEQLAFPINFTRSLLSE